MVGSVKQIIESQWAQFQAERLADLERQQRPITVDQVKELLEHNRLCILEIARQTVDLVLERFEKMEASTVAHMSKELSTRQELLIAKQSETMEALVAHTAKELVSTLQELIAKQSEKMEASFVHMSNSKELSTDQQEFKQSEKIEASVARMAKELSTLQELIAKEPRSEKMEAPMAHMEKELSTLQEFLQSEKIEASIAHIEPDSFDVTSSHTNRPRARLRSRVSSGFFSEPDITEEPNTCFQEPDPW